MSQFIHIVDPFGYLWRLKKIGPLYWEVIYASWRLKSLIKDQFNQQLVFKLTTKAILVFSIYHYCQPWTCCINPIFRLNPKATFGVEQGHNTYYFVIFVKHIGRLLSYNDNNKIQRRSILLTAWIQSYTTRTWLIKYDRGISAVDVDGILTSFITAKCSFLVASWDH